MSQGDSALALSLTAAVPYLVAEIPYCQRQVFGAMCQSYTTQVKIGACYL
mgnify:CR=1 FL=1